MNFFDLHGPAFLGMYVCFFILSIYGAHSAYQHITSVPGPRVVPTLDPYEAAYLSGGSSRTLLSVIASLAERGIVEINAVTKSIELKTDANLTALPPLERELLAASNPEKSVTTLFKEMEPHLLPLRQKLIAMKLLVSEEQYGQAVGAALLILLSLPTFVGLPQLVMGLWHARPVGFLLFWLVASVLAAFISIAVFGRTRLTDLGASVLARLQDQNSALKLTCSTCPSTLSPSDQILAFGLFGAAACAAISPFMTARKALQPAHAGGCGGGGCGGTGCAGGGGCSGGGCGGGCGGCGGGCGG